MNRYLSLSLLLCLGASPVFSANSLAKQAIKSPEVVNVKDYTNITKEDKDVRMKWWRDSKFGVFIHLGAYSVPAGEYKGKRPHPGAAEWILYFGHIPVNEYREYAKQLTLENFDADALVKKIADAGAKYLVFTSKHHDGFCMFDSELTSYDIKQGAPYGKDLLKEVSDAAKKYGLKFCTYYSVMEWDNPALGTIPAKDKIKYLPYMKGQLAELISRYGTELFWFDGEWESWWTDKDGRDIYNYLRTLKPGLIINNRLTKARDGMSGRNKENVFAADYGTPEQEVPSTGLPGMDWESCMTMNTTWGYDKQDHNWKSAEDLVRHLIDTVSKGGNYLLNLGPRADGTVPEPSMERLEQIGQWMKKYSEAIYDTQASPFKKLSWGRATRKGNNYYFFVYSRPADNKVLIPFEGEGKMFVKTLDGNKPLPFKKTKRGLVVDLTQLPGDSSLPSVFRLVAKGNVIDTLIPESNGTFLLDPDSADLSGGLKVEETASSGRLVGAAEKRLKNIGFWTKTEGQIEWKINVPKTKKYAVEITYACNKESGGSSVVIFSGSKTMTWNVPETGGWNDYRTVNAGELALTEGKTTLRLSAASTSGKGIANIRSIVLKPVK